MMLSERRRSVKEFCYSEDANTTVSFVFTLNADQYETQNEFLYCICTKHYVFTFNEL
jgi:hypothetical protein